MHAMRPVIRLDPAEVMFSTLRFNASGEPRVMAESTVSLFG